MDMCEATDNNVVVLKNGSKKLSQMVPSFDDLKYFNLSISQELSRF